MLNSRDDRDHVRDQPWTKSAEDARVAAFSKKTEPAAGIGADPISNPIHYTHGRIIEPIDAIEDWQLSYNLGNAVKYISRAGRKGDAVEDLSKAVFYIQRQIKLLSK